MIEPGREFSVFLPIVAAGQTFADIRTVPTLAITLGVPVVPVGWLEAAAASLAVTIGMAVLLSRRKAIAQTTLVGAWWWSAAALAAWSGVEVAAAFSAAHGGIRAFEPLRLAAMSLGFCPVVALIGAKRPQHRAWGFVVLSLWAILSLPAAELFLLHRGQRLDIGAARGGLLWVLILLGPISFAATRYWLASLLFSAGQVLAFSPHLAVIHRRLLLNSELAGLCLCAAAIAAAWLVSRRTTAAANEYDRLWLDFRDTYGLLWGLRVQERINAAAQQSGWNLQLTWGGFRDAASDRPLTAIDPVAEAGFRATFRGLLRRFVSHAWLNE
jgi:hypothetical protein